MNMSVLKDVKTVFDYLFFCHETVRSVDCIVVFGSSDEAVAVHAASLYNRGLSEKVLFSGGATQQRNRVLSKLPYETEAQWFKAVAVARGVSDSAILLEEKATNTSENVLFTENLIMQHNLLKSRRIIVVQKPYMSRRTMATIQLQWRDYNTIKFFSMPEMVSCDKYFSRISPDCVDSQINTMVGDLNRIIKYAEPPYLYSAKQIVPEKVMCSLQSLIQQGYDKRLV
jgi:hypothetical protein